MVRWFVDRLPQRGIPSVSLRRLLPEAHFLGCADWEVSGCCDDHRRLDPGQVFVAVRGGRPGYDGQAFVREALDRGAAGVVVEQPCPDVGRLQVVVPDASSAHARICQALAGDPSRQMLTAGVTGSFGRTIATLFVRSILEAAGRRTGSLGAQGFYDGTTARPLGAGLTPRPWARPASRTASAGGPSAGQTGTSRRSTRARLAARHVPARRHEPRRLAGRDGRRRLQGGRARGLGRGHGAPLVRRDRLPRRGGDGRRAHPSDSPTRSSWAGDAPRRGCSARWSRAGWSWSTPTIPTPRCWAP